ncbi:hypothetical protein PENTCL1PPCAC_2855, partial [Pristionchus entomophagus]
GFPLCHYIFELFFLHFSRCIENYSGEEFMGTREMGPDGDLIHQNKGVAGRSQHHHQQRHL